MLLSLVRSTLTLEQQEQKTHAKSKVQAAVIICCLYIHKFPDEELIPKLALCDTLPHLFEVFEGI